MNIYVKNRDYVISEFLNNVKIEYRNNREMIDMAIDLTVVLQVAEPNEQFVNDLRGFIVYCDMSINSIKRSSALTTIYHDLAEFRDNRKEDWFCPRTSGYSKYLSGASNIIY